LSGAFLHFGCGLNMLPEPWQNLDPSHDIRKRLRFESGSARAVFAEHVIEHVPYLQALGFFGECLRVLEPGGVLRVAFPDIGRFVRWDVERGYEFNTRAGDYAERLSRRPGMGILESLRTRALEQMLTGWGHQTSWTIANAAGALLVKGFSRVSARDYGEGEFEGIDGHHLDVGPELAKLESTILEATK
jgi:SAM-dependent methyltransferase